MYDRHAHSIPKECSYSHSVIQSIIHSFIHLFIHSFTHSFVCSFVDLFVHFIWPHCSGPGCFTSLAVYIKCSCPEFEIAVGHWPFSDQFAPFGQANPIC